MRWFGRRDRDYAEEMQAHIDMEARENVERGLSPEQARHAARRTFGNVASVREQLLQARPLYWLDTLHQDVRYGCRSITRNPLLAVSVIATLALGVGLNAGVFTLLNAMLFRAEVDKDPSSFVSVYAQYSFANGDRTGATTVTPTDYRAYRDGLRPVGDLAAWQFEDTATEDASPQALRAVLTSCNFFSVYGLDRPRLGRLFLEEDCAATGSSPVAVISEELWRDRLESRPDVVGTAISVNHHPLTIVGVAPARFAGRLGQGALWIPYTMQPQVAHGPNGFQPLASPWLNLSGRLARGRSRSELAARLLVIARQQDQEQPGRLTTVIVTNGSAIEAPGKGSAAFVMVPLFMTPLTLVLLIACVNVSTLLLSRAATRQKEMAVRLSLGAGRIRLVRMLLTESLILALAAGAIGVVLAYQMPALLVKLLGSSLPNYPLDPDWRVFAYLAGATLLTGGIAGLAPAVESLRTDLSSSLKSDEGDLRWRVRRKPSRGWLVGVQIALSLVLLVGAGVVVRAQYRLLSADPSFETRRVLAVRVTPPGGPRRNEDATAAQSLFTGFKQRVEGLPGVQSACYCTAPFSGNAEEVSLPSPHDATRQLASAAEAAPALFDTLRIPLVGGRTFTAEEATRRPWAPVAVVSQRLAGALWPGGDPIGQTMIDGSGNSLAVVGIAREATSGQVGGDVGQFYVLRGRPQSGEVPHNNELLVRFSGDTEALERAVRTAATSVDSGMLVTSQTLHAEIAATGQSLWPATTTALVLAGIGIALAVVGVYGVVAFTVSRRMKELGIRMALGATRFNIVRLVLTAGMRPVLGGAAAGLVLSLGLAASLGRVPRLQGAIPDMRDPIVFAAAALLIGVAALAAMAVPAGRAAGSDPVRALRQE